MTKNRGRKQPVDRVPDVERIGRRRRRAETVASLGLLLVAASLAVAIFNLFSVGVMNAMMWTYTAGALIFTGARVVNVSAPGESVRLRRLRRMEAWSGIAFCIAAGFWFYNRSRFGSGIAYGPMSILHDTILFTLVGAMIQIISSWMIYAREKKEKKEREGSADGK